MFGGVGFSHSLDIFARRFYIKKIGTNLFQARSFPFGKGGWVLFSGVED